MFSTEDEEVDTKSSLKSITSIDIKSTALAATANYGQFRFFVDSVRPVASIRDEDIFISSPWATAATNTDMLVIENRSFHASSMTKTASSILFKQYYYHAANPQSVDIGRVKAYTTTNWTGITATQDGGLVFQAAKNGVMTDILDINHQGSPTLTSATIKNFGTATADADALILENTANDSSMTDTRTSILFNQRYYDASTPLVVDAGKITVGTQTNWTSSAGVQSAYISFSSVSGGAQREHMKILASTHIFIKDTLGTPPTPSGGGYLYVDSGALKFKGSSGTVTTVAAA